MIGSNKRPGFTLIEILVVAAVFALLFLVATTAFVNIQSYQRGILARQRVAADGRYVMEAIARSARIGRIDYQYYRDQGISLVGETDRLVLRDQLGQQTCYRIANNKIMLDDNCTGTETLTPDDLIVENFYVRIQPASDPYAPPPTESGDCNAAPGAGQGFNSTDGVCECVTAAAHCFAGQQCVTAGTLSICQNAVLQPSATIVIHTRSINTQPGERAEITLETTVATRNYGQN